MMSRVVMGRDDSITFKINLTGPMKVLLSSRPLPSNKEKTAWQELGVQSQRYRRRTHSSNGLSMQTCKQPGDDLVGSHQAVNPYSQSQYPFHNF
jgi:hypothetical protein